MRSRLKLIDICDLIPCTNKIFANHFHNSHFIYLPSVLAIVDLMICSSCFVMEMAGMRCSGTVLGKGERGVGGATDLADGE